jgi:hypothetical protein
MGLVVLVIALVFSYHFLVVVCTHSLLELFFAVDICETLMVGV